jgi:hypothetical protein
MMKNKNISLYLALTIILPISLSFIACKSSVDAASNTTEGKQPINQDVVLANWYRLSSNANLTLTLKKDSTRPGLAKYFVLVQYKATANADKAQLINMQALNVNVDGRSTLLRFKKVDQKRDRSRFSANIYSVEESTSIDITPMVVNSLTRAGQINFELRLDEDKAPIVIVLSNEDLARVKQSLLALI